MNNQRYYELVAEELQRKYLRPGLWARAVAETGGESESARALYIRLRVSELIETDRAETSQRLTEEAKVRKQQFKCQIRSYLHSSLVIFGLIMLVLLLSILSDFFSDFRVLWFTLAEDEKLLNQRCAATRLGWPSRFSICEFAVPYYSPLIAQPFRYSRRMK